MLIKLPVVETFSNFGWAILGTKGSLTPIGRKSFHR